MPALILYLLKANVALALFYMAYHVALRRLTFYHLNRLFLVFGILFAALYPLIDVSGLFRQHQELASTYMGTLPAWVTATAAPAHAPALDPWDIPLFGFWLGTGIMAIRLLLQLVSLHRIHAASAPGNHKGIGFRRTRHITQAFSFWQTIYLNPAQHSPEELESILRHEQVHVTGWHTLDVLLAEWSTVFYWFNPGAWLLKNAVKENLEFIADQHVVRTGMDRKAYQYLLLKVVGAPEPAIATQFNFLQLKKRIAMMNKKQSSLLHVARYAVLVPLVAAPLLFAACSEEGAETASPADTAAAAKEQGATQASALDTTAIYYIDGKEATSEAVEQLDPEEIHSVNVLKGESATKVFVDRAANGVIAVTTKKNQNSPEVLQFNKKLLPPPPPSVPDPLYIPDAANLPADYKAFLKRNTAVRQLGWTGNRMNEVIIYLQSGESETYDMSDSKSVAAAEAKYGMLPVLPPPPPPVRKDNK
ncbi:hypothetical protein GCM10023188_22690 [Pontibacter saemangeumensis]|uniref:Peptidase M56 domain-containing protein n=1 Tax=Pontibacter saemangeumensis TaxID=1084525 RepID=A0ABP8LNZ6_9BACT